MALYPQREGFVAQVVLGPAKLDAARKAQAEQALALDLGENVSTMLRERPQLRDPAELDASDPAELDAGDPAELDAGDPAELDAGDPAELDAGDGRWLYIPVRTAADVEEVEQLIDLERGRRRRAVGEGGSDR